ncbi:MAG: hypothetical protein K2F83_01960, partial [Oscillospiraceae bacterium]|nr:hypothetical protein [Oscillospiraceae bacterium]
DPHLADVAFYTTIRDTITAGGHKGLAVIIGLSDSGMRDKDIILPTTLNSSDFPEVLSTSAFAALVGVSSLPVIAVDVNNVDNSGVAETGTSIKAGVTIHRFSESTALTSITIPDSYKAIRRNAFIGTTRLTTVNYDTAVNIATSDLSFWDRTMENGKEKGSSITVVNTQPEKMDSLKAANYFPGAQILEAAKKAEEEEVIDTASPVIATPTQVVGINGIGMLGDIDTKSSRNGTATNSPIIKLAVNADRAETATDGGHVLALTSEGDVYAWGYNGNGQLGNGSTHGANPSSNFATYPIRVHAGVSPYWYTVDNDGERHENTEAEADWEDKTHYLTGVVSIAAGYDHSLALLKDGTVLAWGNTYNGQASTVPSFNRAR